jgi:hypothetical protein
MKHSLQIVMPLVAKASSGNWSQTVSLLRHSLKSVSQLGDVSVLLVGHDYPHGVSLDANCAWLEADFDPPKDNLLASKMQDKGMKVRLGVQHTKRRDEHDWVMFVDADDFVSAKLLKLVDLFQHDAICIKRGYRWDLRGKYCEVLLDFHRVCGTSWMMRLTESNFPVWLGREKERRVCDQAHNSRLEALHKCGARVQMINHPCALYLCHGVNSYWGDNGQRKNLAGLARRCYVGLRRSFRLRRITNELRGEFALPEIHG